VRVLGGGEFVIADEDHFAGFVSRKGGHAVRLAGSNESVVHFGAAQSHEAGAKAPRKIERNVRGWREWTEPCEGAGLLGEDTLESEEAG